MTTEKMFSPSDFAAHLASRETPSDDRLALHRLADEVRRLTDALQGTKAPAALLAETATSLSALQARIAAYGSNARHYGAAESSLATMGHGEAQSDDARFFFKDHSPVAGLGNPIAPPIDFTIEDTKVIGQCTFPRAYEGPPGHVHGGWIAAAFDELLGMAQSLSGAPGMTARLIVNYRRPTPLHTPVRYVGWIDRVEGRKIFTIGQAFRTDTDELLDEAEGLFISMSLQNLMGAAEAVWRAEEAGQTARSTPET